MARALLLVFFLASPAAAEWTVNFKAVEGRVSYSSTLETVPGKPASFSGKARVRGPGQARELMIDALLEDKGKGLFRLSYQAEVSGWKGGRPPLKMQGKALLRPGRPVVAAEAAGWKLILELEGDGEGPAPRMGFVETKLKCRSASYAAGFLYLPDEQYSVTTYSGSGDYERKFMVGLLPGISAFSGEFKLQYTVLLREDRETLAEGGGELILNPGGGWERAAAGEGCVFFARARR